MSSRVEVCSYVFHPQNLSPTLKYQKQTNGTNILGFLDHPFDILLDLRIFKITDLRVNLERATPQIDKSEVRVVFSQGFRFIVSSSRLPPRAQLDFCTVLSLRGVPSVKRNSPPPPPVAPSTPPLRHDPPHRVVWRETLSEIYSAKPSQLKGNEEIKYTNGVICTEDLRLSRSAIA